MKTLLDGIRYAFIGRSHSLNMVINNLKPQKHESCELIQKKIIGKAIVQF